MRITSFSFALILLGLRAQAACIHSSDPEALRNMIISDVHIAEEPAAPPTPVTVTMTFKNPRTGEPTDLVQSRSLKFRKSIVRGSELSLREALNVGSDSVLVQSAEGPQRVVQLLKAAYCHQSRLVTTQMSAWGDTELTSQMRNMDTGSLFSVVEETITIKNISLPFYKGGVMFPFGDCSPQQGLQGWLEISCD